MFFFFSLTIRETREGWPLLLTVEIEANGDLWSTNERSPSLVGSMGSLCRYKRFLFCLGFSIVSPVQNIFFLAPHFFSLYDSQSPSNLGSQAVVQGRLSLSMCLCSRCWPQSTQYTQSGDCRILAYRGVQSHTSLHDRKTRPGWWGWGVHGAPSPPFSILPSRTQLLCIRSSWVGSYTLPISSL